MVYEWFTIFINPLAPRLADAYQSPVNWRN